jgi:hypothetical protein
MAAPFRISRSTLIPKGIASKGDQEFRFYLDRLLKMIPGEVVGLYLVGSGFIPSDRAIVLAIWAAICLMGVVVIRAYGTADPASNQAPQLGPIAVSSVAFVIWVYTLGGPFAAFKLHVPYIGSLLVLTWTFFVPVIYKGPLES